MATSAFGVEHGEVSKAERRMNPAPNTKSPLYLARHSPEAAAVRQAALKPRKLNSAAAIRAGLRATTVR